MLKDLSDTLKNNEIKFIHLFILYKLRYCLEKNNGFWALLKENSKIKIMNSNFFP